MYVCIYVRYVCMYVKECSKIHPPLALPLNLLLLSSNTNEYKNIFWGDKGRPACGTDNLAAICEPIVWRM
jgi:hypothetical protein